MQILVNFVNFVTTSNTLNYHFNVVFLFHCFVVITVVCKKDSFELILNNNFISLIFPLKSQILEICKWHIKLLKSSNFHTILNKLDCWDLIQSIGIQTIVCWDLIQYIGIQTIVCWDLIQSIGIQTSLLGSNPIYWDSN